MKRLLPVLSLALAGCYVLQQGVGQIKLLAARRPVEDVLADPSTSPEARERLLLIQEARKWGESELGLAHTDSYETYVDLHGKPVSWLVTACPPDSMSPKTWWFPIVGTVPYLGFFDIEDAREKRDELKAEGYDVNVRPVPAYSTLGWFSDPVFSTFVEWPEHVAIGTVLHETTHATVWIKGGAPINEALAEIVGDAGARRFLAEKRGADWPGLAEIDRSQEESAKFHAFAMELNTALKFAYALPLPRREKLAMKDALFAAGREKYRELRESFTSPYYRKFDELPWNNALLQSIAVYHEEEGEWRRVLEANGGDLRALLEEAKRIRDDPDPKAALLRAAAKADAARK